MPKIDVREALLENEERITDTCATCSAPAVEGTEPYCIACSEYWADVERGLFDFPEDGMEEGVHP